MLVGLFKVLLFYFAFVFIKNVIKGYLAYQGLKDRMQHDSQGQKTTSQKSKNAHKKSSQGDVFEAEYRVLKDE